jgi:hypothetical protein
VLAPLTWLDDQLNPVLVKELRQALRQRTFLGGFLVALATGCGLTALWMARFPGDNDGGPLLAILQACLALTCYTQVPLGAWMSMEGEQHGRNLDLLLISRMSMAGVLLGKLAASMVQVALYLAAFLPFVCVAALIGAVDLGAVRGLVIEVFARSAALVALALAGSAFARGSGARTLLATGLGLVGVLLVGWQVNLVRLVLASSLELQTPRPTLFNQVLGASMELGAAAVLIAGAYGRLEHPAINTSSRIRLVVTAVVVAMVVRGWFFVGATARPGGWVLAHGLIGALILLAPGTFFVTEPERVRHSHRRWIPRSGFGAVLVAPWMPGGGRGMLFVTSHALLFYAGCVLATEFNRAGANWGALGFGGVTFVCGYATLAAASLGFDLAQDHRLRARLRVGVPVASLLVGLGALGLSSSPQGARFVGGFLRLATIVAVLLGGAQSMRGVMHALDDGRRAALVHSRARGRRST